MRIKYKGKEVDVSREECPTFRCFSPNYYEHRGRTIDGKSNGYMDKHLSCSYRNYHGCPYNPKEKKP